MSKYLFESDYSADSLRWYQRREHSPEKLSNEELEKLQEEIISTNDSPLAYFFSTEFNYRLHRMQKVILDNKDAKYAFLFAQNIRICDIRALQKLVVDSKKIKYICKFACFVPGADQDALETMVLKSKSAKYAYMMLRHIKGLDTSKYRDIIIKSGKPRYLFELAKHTKDPDELARIEDLIIGAKSFLYMRMMAEKIKLANVEKIEQAVLDLDNVNEIKKFAKYVKRSKMKRFILVL